MRTRRAKAHEGVVVVTGASSGMGYDASLYLNDLGYTVFAGVRRLGDCDELRAQVRRPDELLPLELDVTRPEQVEAAAATVAAHVGPEGGVAGLFSNAGIANYDGDVSCEGLPMEALDRIMAVNFTGGVRFVRAFLPLVRAAHGTVVLNSALMAHTVIPFNGGYAASKRALEGWADSLRREVHSHGVRVVIIEAAAIHSALAAKQDPDRVPEGGLYPEQRKFVARAMHQMERSAGKPSCSPRRVSEIVATAIASPRPRPRYVVGGGARPIWLLGALPDRLQDRAMSLMVAAMSR